MHDTGQDFAPMSRTAIAVSVIDSGHFGVIVYVVGPGPVRRRAFPHLREKGFCGTIRARGLHCHHKDPFALAEKVGS
jgi:hypothetical protein